MSELNKAFVIGGYGQSEEILEPLRHAIKEHPGFNFDIVDSITLGVAQRKNDIINRDAKKRGVFVLSYASMVIHQAGMITVLNGVEPTSIRQQIRGARATSSPEIREAMGREPQVPILDDKLLYRELAKHPLVTILTPIKITRSSSVQKLIDGGEAAYPGGRAYFPSDNDEFGFGGFEDVNRARQHGITAAIFPGYHGQALFHPRATVDRVYNALNQPINT